MKRDFYFAMLVVTFVLSGCANATVYRQSPASEDHAAPIAREVRFELRRTFYEDAPACVVVLPTVGAAPPELKKSLARSLARYLTLKVPRVVTPTVLSRLARKQAIDLDSETGWRMLAMMISCPHAVQAEIQEVSDLFVGVWAQKQLTVELRLMRAKDGAVLWDAGHSVARGDGGLPLSPLSLGVGFFKAASHSRDAEVMLSMLDDALRRMMVTLPDIR